MNLDNHSETRTIICISIYSIYFSYRESLKWMALGNC